MERKTRKKWGKTPGRLHTAVSAELEEAVERMAEASGMDRSTWIRNVLQAAVAQQEVV